MTWNWAALPVTRRPNYTSSTSITDANTNLKTALATRVFFNDPTIVGVLIKPDEVSHDLVKNIKDNVLKDRDILNFLTAVREQTFQFESDMYEPLVRRN